MKFSLVFLTCWASWCGIFSQNLFQEEQKIVASNRVSFDEFGRSIALDGFTAIVGGGGGVGPNVFFLEKDSAGIWQPTQTFFINQNGTTQTYAVDIHGEVAVMGMAGAYIGSGAIYIFERDSSGSWQYVQELIPVGINDDDFFGESVAIWGNQVVSGATFMDNGVGTVWTFEKDSLGTWQETQMITASDGNAGDWFGKMVEVDSIHLVISAPRNSTDPNGNFPVSGAGAVYVFEKNMAGFWEEKQKLVASDRGIDEMFGACCSSGLPFSILSLSSRRLLIGAGSDRNGLPGDSMIWDAGAAFFFEKDSNNIWMEKQKVVPSDRETRAFFGSNVQLTDNFALIGAYPRNPGTLQEAAFLFQYINGSWVEAQKLIASDGQFGDMFGNAVALQGSEILIGAYGEGHDAQGNNYLAESGSIYYYDICAIRGDTLWVDACDSFPSPSGNFVWNQSGWYTDMLASSLGCDSVVDIHLTINSVDASISQVGNDSLQSTGDAGLYQWLDCANGYSPILGANDPLFVPDRSGTYALEVNTPEKCVDTSDCVFICIPPNAAISHIEDTLMAEAEDGTYQWLDCTNGFLPIFGATDKDFVPTGSGSYAVQVGIADCLDTSDCVAFIPTGVSDPLPLALRVFPNPSQGEMTVEFGSVLPDARIRLVNSLGQTVGTHQVHHLRTATLFVELPKGLYVLLVEGSGGMVASVPVQIE